MVSTNKQNANWNFLPVHTSRVIKVLDKAVIIKLDKNNSCILPRVFMRKKQTQDFVFFSVPADFVINVRTSVYDKETKSYKDTDKQYKLTGKTYEHLKETLDSAYEVEKAPVKDDELPF